MKKLFSIGVALCLCFSTAQLYASCNGNHYDIDYAHYQSYLNDFFLNCCEGDQISFTDIDTGDSWTLNPLHNSGANSSCTQQ